MRHLFSLTLSLLLNLILLLPWPSPQRASLKNVTPPLNVHLKAPTLPTQAPSPQHLPPLRPWDYPPQDFHWPEAPSWPMGQQLGPGLLSIWPQLPGRKEDQWNPVEKVYFSFQRRMLRQYIQSFVKTYQDGKRRHPQWPSPWGHTHHLLKANVTFDQEGHILSIKVVQSSSHQEVHNLFEQTLKNLPQIPNPPRDFLNEDQEFSVSYVLEIQ